MLGLGTADNPAGPNVMAAAVVAAVQADITLFDTAQNYGSELALGRGLHQAGIAGDSVFLLCKVDIVSRKYEEPVARVRRQVANTLRNLGAKRLDAVVIHWPICLDGPCADTEHAAVRRTAWAALESLVEEGTVGCIGVSNWNVQLLDELLSYAKIKPALNEIEFSPACYQHELVAASTARGVAVVGYSPYGSCWMAKCCPDIVPWGRTDLTDDPTVQSIAAKAGCTPAQLLLRWSLWHGVVCIPKSVRAERITESSRAFDAVLSEEQVVALGSLSDTRRGTCESIDAHLRFIASDGYDWRPT